MWLHGIYFAAKSGRVCGNGVVKASEGGDKMIGECDLRREYLKPWDAEFMLTRFGFWICCIGFSMVVTRAERLWWSCVVMSMFNA